jgi:general secretion pathway protein C
MQRNTNSLWWPRAVTFFLAALAALSATFWVMKALGPSAPPAAAPAMALNTTFTIDPQIVALALGGGKQALASEAVPLVSRYVLVGVVADQDRSGAALIAVDGKPAKAVRVGAAVDDTLVLQSVVGRRAVLAANAKAPAAVTLELPPLVK